LICTLFRSLQDSLQTKSKHYKRSV